MSRAMPLAWNFIAYQLAWFAVILGAAHGLAWAGAAFAVLLTLAQVALQRDPLDRRLIALAALIGFLVDTTLVKMELIDFQAHWPEGAAPFWMLSLWIAFATTLNRSLRWLMLRPPLAALAGALGGPLAYLAGEKLGALSFTSPAISLAVIALLWTPAMVIFSMMVLRAALLPEARRIPT